MSGNSVRMANDGLTLNNSGFGFISTDGTLGNSGCRCINVQGVIGSGVQYTITGCTFGAASVRRCTGEDAELKACICKKVHDFVIEFLSCET